MESNDIAFAGIARQAQLIRDGAVSPRELVDLYLDRIARLDPELGAFRVVYAERARAEADQASGRRGAGDERPLLGVPIALKDNYDVAGDVTTMGSGAYDGPAAADAEFVRRLRGAGAILIGKTLMPELAIFPWTESATWGVTRNPWDTSRTPGGSSGGSATAVAAGLVGAASASDGGGSIRIPAACCGLFGLKPQRDRVPSAEDHWHGLTSLGVVTRSVRDSALYLDVVSDGSQSYVEAAVRSPGKLKIALSLKPPAPARVDRRVRQAVEAVADALRSLGHVVEPRDPDYPRLESLFPPRWFRGIHDDARAMAYPGRLERRTRALTRVGALFPPAVMARIRAAEPAATRRINTLFDDYDVLLTPVMPAPPDPLRRFEGRSWIAASAGAGERVAFTTAWNVTGQPAAAVPAPLDDAGVPLSAQLIGRPDDEGTLISLAAQLEAELRWTERRPAL